MEALTAGLSLKGAAEEDGGRDGVDCEPPMEGKAPSERRVSIMPALSPFHRFRDNLDDLDHLCSFAQTLR